MYKNKNVQTSQKFEESEMYNCKITHLENITNDIVIVKLKLIGNTDFKFQPGQYIEVYFNNNIQRKYSIADFVKETNNIELHIKYTIGGEIERLLKTYKKSNYIFHLKGSFGHFLFNYEPNKSIIFLSSGTGISPIKSILNNISHNYNIHSKIFLYWGMCNENELYMNQDIEKWKNSIEYFNYIPVLSAPISKNTWYGRIGYVNDIILEDFNNLSKFQVYACGSRIMIENAYHNLINHRGLSRNDFYSDIFSPYKNSF